MNPYDLSKQGFNNYPNQYPPMTQTQYGLGTPYPPNNAPPPYVQYPAPAAGYPSPGPSYQQHGFVATPVHHPSNNLVQTQMTSGLKAYFMISGIFYLIWAALALGLEVGIIINSRWTYYRGIWTAVFLIAGGISMLAASCRESYVMFHLVRWFCCNLSLGVLALILSIVNLSTSYRCTSSFYWRYCDHALATNLKITILVLFIVVIAHTIANLIVASNAQKRSAASIGTNAIRHQ
ncbi:hypothetical protein I4U23_014711 [Adineta vaga]|nr:hypothetical protein I4U23_014711 [Adineta vaga]